MPRYLIERRFPGGLQFPPDAPDTQAGASVAANNLRDGVRWLQSYLSPDRTRSFCIYDGPTSEAIRRAADRNQLPVHDIVEVGYWIRTSTTQELETA